MGVRHGCWGFGTGFLLCLAASGLSGCDYWPPALQAQIEQLRSETQLAAAERAKAEGQLRDAVKQRDELQARVDELTRLNRDLAARATTLQQSLTAEQEKSAKLTKSGSKGAAAKGKASKSAKTTPKKRAVKGSVQRLQS